MTRKIVTMSGTPHCGVRLASWIQRAALNGLPFNTERYCSAEGTDQETHKRKSSEAVMDGSRSERARARAQHLLAQIAPLPDDSEVQRLRELSINYIREAERLEQERTATREPGEQSSVALDAIARDFFARAAQAKAKR